MAPNGRPAPGPRCIAIVGPFQSGKTTLLEAILERTGTVQRSGRVTNGDTVGDASAEARAHGMTVEPNIATVSFLGETMTFVDCPGSVEFLYDMRMVDPVCDAAIVVCEADERKIPALEIVLRELEEADIPRFLFINKIDQASRRVRETLALLQRASRTPLLLRQIPIWKDGIAVGFIDLALERAFIYREHAPSEVVEMPEGELPREREARFAMLERLADYDDALMEDLLSDIEPPRDRVFDDLARELRERFGLDARTISGDAEARLSFLGATAPRAGTGRGWAKRRRPRSGCAAAAPVWAETAPGRSQGRPDHRRHETSRTGRRAAPARRSRASSAAPALHPASRRGRASPILRPGSPTPRDRRRCQPQESIGHARDGLGIWPHAQVSLAGGVAAA